MLGLSSCSGFSCPAACGILVPQPGIELVSSVLAGKLFTTGPLGKSKASVLKGVKGSSTILAIWSLGEWVGIFVLVPAVPTLLTWEVCGHLGQVTVASWRWLSVASLLTMAQGGLVSWFHLTQFGSSLISLQEQKCSEKTHLTVHIVTKNHITSNSAENKIPGNPQGVLAKNQI